MRRKKSCRGRTRAGSARAGRPPDRGRPGTSAAPRCRRPPARRRGSRRWCRGRRSGRTRGDRRRPRSRASTRRAAARTARRAACVARRRRGGAAASAQQRGRADEDVVLAVQAHGVQLRIVHAHRAHRAVHLAGAHADQQIAARAEVELDRHLRVTAAQQRQHRNDPRHAELVARPQHQFLRRRPGLAASRAQARVGGGERLLRVPEQRQPRLAQRHPAGRAMKQRLPICAFELRDALTERRGRQRDGPRGGAKVEQPRRLDEAAQRLERRRRRRRQRRRRQRRRRRRRDARLCRHCAIAGSLSLRPGRRPSSTQR